MPMGPEYDQRLGSLDRAIDRSDIDAGLRAYMLQVYNYMAMALAVTGVVAYATYSMAVDATSSGLMLTDFGYALYGSPLKWVVMLAPLGFVFFFMARLHALSLGTAQTVFWAYSAAMGVSLSSIFLVYTGESITQVFFITAATFGSMSLWGYTTKRDLSGMGSFLFMGLIGIIIAMVVNIFLQSDMMSWVISVIGVLVFTGLTAYDTQMIKSEYVAGDSTVVAGKKALYGALHLYLDFINLFLMLLSLLGDRE